MIAFVTVGGRVRKVTFFTKKEDPQKCSSDVYYLRQAVSELLENNVQLRSVLGVTGELDVCGMHFKWSIEDMCVGSGRPIPTNCDSKALLDIDDDDEIPDMQSGIVFTYALNTGSEANCFAGSVTESHDISDLSETRSLFSSASTIILHDVDEIQCTEFAEFMDTDDSDYQPPLLSSTQLASSSNEALEKYTSSNTSDSAAHQAAVIVTNSCDLPTLPDNLQKAFIEGSLHGLMRPLMKFFCDHFAAVFPNPTKRDYDVYTRTLCDMYHLTEKGNSKQLALFRAKFVQSSSNRRMYAKHKPSRLAKAAEYRAFKNGKAATVLPAAPQSFDDDASPEAVEAKLCSLETSNMETWKQLLTLHFHHRRQSLGIVQSLRDRFLKFSYFRNPVALLAEFELLIGSTMAVLHENLDGFLKACAVIHPTGGDDCVSRLVAMNAMVVTAQLKKMENPFFVRKLVGDTIVDSVSEDASPFAVLYEEDGAVKEASVIAFGGIFFHLREVTIKQLVFHLLATYYVYDMEYPKPYAILKLLDEHTLPKTLDQRKHFLVGQTSRYVKVSKKIAKEMSG